MEVIMSSPVHESSSMENEGSKCPDKPTKSKNRRSKWTPERRRNKRQRNKEQRTLYYRENPDASTVSKGVENTKATNDSNDASKKRKRKKRKKNNKTVSTEAQDMVTINKDSTKTLEGIAGSTGAVKLNSKQKHTQRQRQLRRMYNLFAIGFQKQQLDQKQAKLMGFQKQVKADLKKKLLILDVNGVLAHVVHGKIDGADHYTRNDSIFKRPHLDSFLEFCFERFNVGIWSTKQYRNLLPVDFLLPNLKEKLLFIWDGSSSTKTKKNTVDNKGKPIQFKHLGKFWESNGPCKSWVKGNFNKSNTLLVDDSPYKALLNPENTAIFPSSYNHLHKEGDDLLGTNGNMRVYLEGVAKCEHVQLHVQQHPFGQPAMDENHQHWNIYKDAADSIHTPKNRLIHSHRRKHSRNRCINRSFHYSFYP